MVCNDGPVPLTNGDANTLVDTCSSAEQCDWVCDQGYTKVGTECLPPTGEITATDCSIPA